MSSISFAELLNNNNVSTIVKKTNGGAKNGKLNETEQKYIMEALGCGINNDIKKLAVVCPDGTRLTGGSQQALVKFARHIVSVDDSYRKLQFKNWFYKEDSIDDKSRYGSIGKDSFLIFRDAKVTMNIVRIIKMLLDAEVSLDNYSFEYNILSKSSRDQKGTALADEDVDTIHYWLYAPGDNANKWEEFYEKGIMAIGWGELGDLTQYDNKADIKGVLQEVNNSSNTYRNVVHATWQFANEIKVGDIVYAKKGIHQIIGRGVVTSDYYYDDTHVGYENMRKVNWTNKGSWPHPSTSNAVQKALTDITAYPDYVEEIENLFDDDNEYTKNIEEKAYPEYNAEQFLSEVYMDKEQYNTLVNLLEKKQNIILQGAPGVGKTFTAKRLAYSILGEKNPNRVMFVQFHQSYSYEDFIEGFRPTQDGKFVIKKGSFYKFCKTADEDDHDNKYFFIIDEINRGNLSKIFGELFMLIEQDKRGNELNLLYSDDKFAVPDNVYIIGMMNTADRSLAMLDYALRRRFAFFDMPPGFQSEGFRKYRDKLNAEKFNKLISEIEKLNEAIRDDDSLGEGFCIGHSYFCGLNEVTDSTLEDIIKFELIPLLKEYWFDEPQKIKDWSNNLWRAIGL